MQDHLIRATIPGMRAFAAVTTHLTETARKRHDCFPIAAAALGRTMTGSLLLAAGLKNDEAITVRIQGSGPLGKIVADAGANGSVRGYVENPKVDLPLKNNKLNVGEAVGKGNLYVTRFTGLKDPFTGSVELVSGEIAEDLTHYLAVSEQTPSLLALGVLVNTDLSVAAAGGLMLQALPGAEEDVITAVEENVYRLPSMTQMLAAGKTPADILASVFEEFPLSLHGKTKLAFRCQCSRQKVEKVLISLGKEELDDMIKEGQAELTCHFCADQYHFTRKELQAIRDRALAAGEAGENNEKDLA